MSIVRRGRTVWSAPGKMTFSPSWKKSRGHVEKPTKEKKGKDREAKGGRDVRTGGKAPPRKNRWGVGKGNKKRPLGPDAWAPGVFVRGIRRRDKGSGIRKKVGEERGGDTSEKTGSTVRTKKKDKEKLPLRPTEPKKNRGTREERETCGGPWGKKKPAWHKKARLVGPVPGWEAKLRRGALRKGKEKKKKKTYRPKHKSKTKKKNKALWTCNQAHHTK